MAAPSHDLASHPFKWHHLPGGFSPPPPPAEKTRVGATDRGAGGSSDVSDDWWLRSVPPVDLAASSSPRGTTKPSTSAVAAPVQQGFQLNAGCCYMPKKGQNLLGEDAYFISKGGKAFGVADGVGSWTRQGIDAGEFARHLMASCDAQIRRISCGAVIGTLLQGVMKTAMAGTTAKGTSTACVGAVDGPFLWAVSVGDSGFMVVRGGAVAYRSPPHQKHFNHPFQIGRLDPADPLDSAFKVRLAPGDVVVTDGLFDNLFNGEIAALVTSEREERPNRPALNMAHALAAAAAAVAAFTGSKDSPFAEARRAAGLPRTGGHLEEFSPPTTCFSQPASSSQLTRPSANQTRSTQTRIHYTPTRKNTMVAPRCIKTNSTE